MILQKQKIRKQNMTQIFNQATMFLHHKIISMVLVDKLVIVKIQHFNIGIKHARAVVKSRSGKNPMPIAPLMMIDGAAGSGKSSTINFDENM